MKLIVTDFEKISLQPINISIVELKYNAKYVGDFCLKTNGGGWSDFPIAIFYQPNPDLLARHTNYFGIFVDEDHHCVITNGESAFSEPITGLITDDGTVIYSRYRHDYVTSKNGELFIDGGRDYTRFSDGHHRLVKLLIDKDKLVIDPNSIDPVFVDGYKPKRITTLTSPKELK